MCIRDSAAAAAAAAQTQQGSAAAARGAGEVLFFEREPNLAVLSVGLPEHWEAMWDAHTKGVYYGNSATRVRRPAHTAFEIRVLIKTKSTRAAAPGQLHTEP